MTKENEVSAPALAESPNIQGGGLDSLIATLERADAELPAGEWQMQNSCRCRRIGSGTRDGNILRAYRQASDGHPDLSMPEEQVEALCQLRNALPAALDFLRALKRLPPTAPNIQGGGLDSGWRTMESAPRDGTVVDLWMGADEFPHRVTDAKWCKPEHTCAGPNCDMCPGDVDEYAWREALTGYEYAIGTLAGPTHWRPPLPPTAPNTTATSNVTGADASDEDAEDLATAEASYAEYQENGGVTLDELKAELDAADSRDALIEELRGALGHFVSTAVMEAETHRVYVDEWVLSAARSAYAKAHALSRTGREG